MKSNLLKILVVSSVTVLLPLLAVTFGVPDGNAHPFVGLVVVYDSQGNPLWRCSGSLISDRVFLTAAHCTEAPAATARVWFDEVVGTNTGYPWSGGTSGVPHPHPDWNGSLTLPNTRDIGVVVLNEPVTLSTYAALPTEGQLDGLAVRRGLNDVSFKVVGYGLQGVKPEYLSARERRRGTTRLVNLSSSLTDGYNIHLSNNPGHWSGGTCFGDSGGPVFLNDTNTVVAVNSFVMNNNCAGSGFGYRVDTADSLQFIASKLPQ